MNRFNLSKHGFNFDDFELFFENWFSTDFFTFESFNSKTQINRYLQGSLLKQHILNRNSIIRQNNQN